MWYDCQLDSHTPKTDKRILSGLIVVAKQKFKVSNIFWWNK